MNKPRNIFKVLLYPSGKGPITVSQDEARLIGSMLGEELERASKDFEAVLKHQAKHERDNPSD